MKANVNDLLTLTQGLQNQINSLTEIVEILREDMLKLDATIQDLEDSNNG